MSEDRFLIAPIKDGLRTDMTPWLLPESAFARMRNAYIYEGRIRKRFGSTYSGTVGTTAITQQLGARPRIALVGGAAVGITDGTGAAAGSIPGLPGSLPSAIGQMFSIGTELFTVWQDGQMLRTGPNVNACTYDTATGAYVFANAAFNTQIYFYPSLPIMGLTNFEVDGINERNALAFDTRFAYEYAGGSWNQVGPTAAQQFNGTDSDFFQTCVWRGPTADAYRMFVTNYNDGDPMWSYDNTGLTGWAHFQPQFLAAGNFVRTARIILPFKDHLILLSTIEDDGAGALTTYTNRCRFSHNGSPLDANAFTEPNQAGYTGGGWIDASTKEEIVGAEFIKDRLIVYFERSTWELAYTGNKVQPYLWQKINSELGSDSTFSTVPFDKVVLGIGTTGIHACNGSNVSRIDSEIPTEIFEIRNDNEGIKRVAGIRDYFTETVYWTIPDISSGVGAETYPNNVIVYNYKDGTWAINDDSFTAFGYFEQDDASTWANTDLTWGEADFAWSSGSVQANFRTIIAGNQEGFITTLNSDVSTNASAMQITNITIPGAIPPGQAVDLFIYSHNLNINDFIKVDNCQGVTGINGKIYKVETVTGVNQVRIFEPVFVLGAGYTGGGTVSRVSKIDILTKRYNPYIEEGSNISIDSVDFAVQKTSNGVITVDYSPSSTNISMIEHATNSGAILGNNVLETSAYDLVPLEDEQDLLWHRVYFNTDGDSVQLRLYMSDTQMTDVPEADPITGVALPPPSEEGFQLEGFILNVSKAGRVN